MNDESPQYPPKRMADIAVDRSFATVERMHVFVLDKIDTMIKTLESLKAHKIAAFDAAKAAFYEDGARADKAAEICKIIEEWVQANREREK